MTDSATLRSPVVVGPVSVDVLYGGDEGSGGTDVFLRFGGVCHNVACTLATLGLEPVLVSPRFSGDIGECVPGHLAAHHVRWSPTSHEVPLSLFTAEIGSTGNVSNERFIDGGAARVLDASSFRNNRSMFREASAIVSCSDLSRESLSQLAEISYQLSVPFCLVSTSVEEVNKVHLDRKPDVIGLNVEELQTLCGLDPASLDDMARAAAALVGPDGACIVTLGARGALVCTPGAGEYVFQPVDAVSSRRTVGAGDVLFAITLARRLRGATWADSLQNATALVSSFIQSDPHGRTQRGGWAEVARDVPGYERRPL